jgi:hypothetical protein
MAFNEISVKTSIERPPLGFRGAATGSCYNPDSFFYNELMRLFYGHVFYEYTVNRVIPHQLSRDHLNSPTGSVLRQLVNSTSYQPSCL